MAKSRKRPSPQIHRALTRRVHAGYMASLLERQAAQDRMEEASEDEQEMGDKEEMEEMEENKE